MKNTLVLLGAARSGTKLLRDLIAAHPEVSCVPHDVNFVWGAGLRAVGHDEFAAELATPRRASLIRRRLESHRDNTPWLVEKTVSNTLRVPFVDRVLPHASYLHLVRDGRDVVLSSHEQWSAPTDWSRLLTKLRYVPFSQLPSYAWDYLRSRGSGSDGPTAWGVRPAQLDDWVRNLPLLEVNAHQWVASVAAALAGLEAIDPARQMSVRYEDLVGDPSATLEKILGFMGLSGAPEVTAATGGVRTDLIGSRRGALDPAASDRLTQILTPTMQRLGYEMGPAVAS